MFFSLKDNFVFLEDILYLNLNLLLYLLCFLIHFNIGFSFILLFELFLLFELKFRLVVSSDNIFWVFGSVFIGSKSPGLKILSFKV